MDLSVIIVNWNVRQFLYTCLTSILAQTQSISFEVFVVDNASTDGSCEMIEKEFPQVKLIKNKTNRGFAAANNQAIKLAQGDYVLLLNPDTQLLDNSLEKLFLFAKNNPKASVITPKLLFSDGRLQLSVRRLPGFWDQFFILLKLHNFFPKLSAVKKYYMFDFNYQQTAKVEQVMGAAMLIKREVFGKVGLLDEKFWLLFEEVDFCQRLKQAGCEIYYYPKAQIIHHKAKSFNQRKTLAKQINFNHNLFNYFKKHKPFYQLFFLWLLQPISLFLAAVDQFLGIKQRVGKDNNL